MLNANLRFCGLSLRRAQKQYGLNDSVRRMRSDHEPMIKRNRLDFVTTGSIAIETVKGCLNQGTELNYFSYVARLRNSRKK